MNQHDDGLTEEELKQMLIDNPIFIQAIEHWGGKINPKFDPRVKFIDEADDE